MCFLVCYSDGAGVSESKRLLVPIRQQAPGGPLCEGLNDVRVTGSAAALRRTAGRLPVPKKPQSNGLSQIDSAAKQSEKKKAAASGQDHKSTTFPQQVTDQEFQPSNQNLGADCINTKLTATTSSASADGNSTVAVQPCGAYPQSRPLGFKMATDNHGKENSQEQDLLLPPQHEANKASRHVFKSAAAPSAPHSLPNRAAHCGLESCMVGEGILETGHPADTHSPLVQHHAEKEARKMQLDPNSSCAQRPGRKAGAEQHDEIQHRLLELLGCPDGVQGRVAVQTLERGKLQVQRSVHQAFPPDQGDFV